MRRESLVTITVKPDGTGSILTLLHEMFFDEAFTERMIGMSIRSAAIRSVLRDLVEGSQEYTSLKSRLLRSGPRYLLDSALGRLGLARA